MIKAKEIMGILHQQHPFILIDRITELDGGVSCTAIKNVTLTEPCFQGHFPGDPVFPGVYIIEAMAQAGGMIFAESGSSQIGVIAAVDKVKFLREVIPGDTLVLHCRLDSRFGRLAKVAVSVEVDGQPVAKGEISYSFSEPSKPEGETIL